MGNAGGICWRNPMSWYLLSSKLLHNYGKSAFFLWENQLFLWQSSIAMFTRGHTRLYTLSKTLCHLCLHKLSFGKSPEFTGLFPIMLMPYKDVPRVPGPACQHSFARCQGCCGHWTVRIFPGQLDIAGQLRQSTIFNDGQLGDPL